VKAVSSPLYLSLPEEGAGKMSNPLKHKTADRAMAKLPLRNGSFAQRENEVILPFVVVCCGAFY
jgi:hypothetical protein